MKIAIAGAGHGGLVAGAILAKHGYDVCLYEKGKKEDLGHDWEDRFTFSLLSDITGREIDKNSWRYRGDCAFVSPSYRTNVIINYTDENRQKIMKRKYLISELIRFAEESGVKFFFETEVTSALIEKEKVVGINTSLGEIRADLVIDAAGVFSPVRMTLPESYHIEKSPNRGDLFYAWRGYFNKTEDVNPEVPFEVYLCHNKEQGLSWCCTNPDSVDILIGRIDPPSDEQIEKAIAGYREKHPYIGKEILHGGVRGVIPVRRPLALMVGEGYVAVGDSAFMTTPMNGMGIDLSLHAGEMLAITICENGNATISTLWEYNKCFHELYGGFTSKNEGLKNSLLEMPGEGVDFLFDNGVIQASDLAGAGTKTSIPSLLMKFVHGMKNPPYFFAILGGIMKGAKMKKTLEHAPATYNREAVLKWQSEVQNEVLKVTRK